MNTCIVCNVRHKPAKVSLWLIRRRWYWLLHWLDKHEFLYATEYNNGWLCTYRFQLPKKKKKGRGC